MYSVICKQPSLQMTLVMRRIALCKCEKRLDEYLSEIYVRMHVCQKIWAILIPKSENRAIHSALSFLKKGVYHIPVGAEKGLFGMHIRTMSYIGSYPHQPLP